MRTTVFVLDHSPEAAAAVRYAARQASNTSNALRVVSPLNASNGRVDRLDADPVDTREARRDHTQRWILDEAAPYLEQLTIRIEFPDGRLPTALSKALRGTELLVTGSDRPVAADAITSDGTAIVQVTATGRVDCVAGTAPAP